MDPVFWVLFFSEALGPIPNWILFRFPLSTTSFLFLPAQMSHLLPNHLHIATRENLPSDSYVIR